MKIFVTISRIIVGVLFIFSGLVKAIDPLGLTYKMQEFFEAWGNAGFFKPLMNSLNDYALWFSLIMITLEVMLGVALLLGVQKKLTGWLLLLLVVFFTFLTSYVLFSGKIKACGCFGDCIPLTPVQTFSKDVILLVLVLLILYGIEHVKPVLPRKINRIIFVLSTIGVIWLQWHVLTYLPLKDCLPYKVGNNILELRKMPAGAISDKYDYVFVYEKGGTKKEFSVSSLPDSSWKFVERKQTLVQKGVNNVPLINDFYFSKEDTVMVYTKDGVTNEFAANAIPDSTWQFIEKKTIKQDVTETVLGQEGDYYLLFLKKIEPDQDWLTDFYNFYTSLTDKSKVYIVTSDFKAANSLFNSGRNPIGLQILVCDATAIKTAARVNPTLYKMHGPVVKEKWSWANFDDLTHN